MTTPDEPSAPASAESAGADTTPPEQAKRAARTAGPRQQQTLWPEGYTLTRSDKTCGGLLALMAGYGLVMLPLRPLLLGMAPIILVFATGSMTATVACGALAATGRTELVPLALLLGTIGIVKFDPVVWWAGRLWGDGFIRSMVGPSPRAQKRASRAEALARKYEVLAIAAKYIPFVPIPSGIIFAVLGAAGTKLRTFLLVDVICALVTRAGYLYLGYRIGEPAVAVLEEYSKYAWYLAIAMIVVVFVGAWRSAAKAAKQDDTHAERAEDDRT